MVVCSACAVPWQQLSDECVDGPELSQHHNGRRGPELSRHYRRHSGVLTHAELGHHSDAGPSQQLFIVYCAVIDLETHLCVFVVRGLVCTHARSGNVSVYLSRQLWQLSNMNI